MFPPLLIMWHGLVAFEFIIPTEWKSSRSCGFDIENRMSSVRHRIGGVYVLKQYDRCS